MVFESGLVEALSLETVARDTCKNYATFNRYSPIFSSVGIATGYGLDDRGVGFRVPVGSRIFSSPNSPDRLWGPPSLLYNGYERLFPLG
jgi:hypothetical protein